MNVHKSLVAFLAAGLALTVSGCVSREGGGGRAAQFTIGSDKANAAARPVSKKMGPNPVAYEVDMELSPEASIKRDLERLRQKEREQAKNVSEMKDAMAQGTEIIRKEEERLADMRRQIERFESAERLYRQTAADGDRAGAVYGAVGAAAPDPREYERGYGANPAVGYDPAPSNAVVQTRVGYPDPRQGTYGGNLAERQLYPAPGTGTQTQIYSPQTPPVEDEPVWNPPEKLFSLTSNPARPVQLSRTSRESVPPPAQPRRQAQPVPAMPPETGAEGGVMNDDVFIPDLFLSKGK